MPNPSDAGGYTDEQVAQIVHNLVVAVHEAVGEPRQARWAELPADAWQREDALRQVRAVRVHGLTAQEDHEVWKRSREQAGWTVGDTFDAQHKRNPRLVPWEDLSFRDRARSQACFQVIRTLLGLG